AAERSPPVDPDICVMHNALVTRLHFDCPYIFCDLDIHRQDEISENIASISRQMKWQGHGNNQIRLAQLPLFVELRRHWAMRSITFGRSLLNPVLDEVQLRISQAAFSDEIAVTLFRKRGRHVPPARDGDD